jgi:predicted component of type VI protein secretion system
MISGPNAGHSVLASRFPFVIGRDPACGWAIEGAGVWARHATLTLDTREGFHIRSEPPALLAVNGSPVTEARLRNGDNLDLGAARVRFSLSDIQCRSYRAREAATWLAIALLTMGQIALVYCVLP